MFKPQYCQSWCSPNISTWITSFSTLHKRYNRQLLNNIIVDIFIYYTFHHFPTTTKKWYGPIIWGTAFVILFKRRHGMTLANVQSDGNLQVRKKYLRERPFNLKGGLWFFSKKIFPHEQTVLIIKYRCERPRCERHSKTFSKLFKLAKPV
jgi:hypothetical protein